MKFLSATLATVVGAASADPALIAMPAGQYMGAAQPVYVAATQPRLVAPQPVLLEQQVMRTPQMATMPHLYNIQPVASYPHIIPAPQQYIDADTIKEMKVVQPQANEEVSQQYHSQDEFGNYSYGYANNNSEKQEVGNTRTGQVKGYYTYVDGAGKKRIDYVADNNGFRAAGDGIPEQRIKREAEPEAEPEAKPEAEAEPKKEMVQMTSYMNNNGQQEGMKMSSYMSDMQSSMPRQSMSRMSMSRPSMMTYTNDMLVNPMVYMSMDAPRGATLTASRMTNQDMYMNNDMRRMDNMHMDGMRMDNMRMGMNDLHRDNMMMGRNDMRMNNNRDMYRMMNRDGYRGQYLNNNMYRGRDMLRDSMFKTNPSNFMEIQQYEMKPNYNYRFDF